MQVMLTKTKIVNLICSIQHAGNVYSKMYLENTFSNKKGVYVHVYVFIMTLLCVKFVCVFYVEIQKWIDTNFRRYNKKQNVIMQN